MSRFRISWPGILGFLTSICGVLADPVVFGLLSHKVAVGVTIGGVVLQAVTRAVIVEHATTKFPGSPV